MSDVSAPFGLRPIRHPSGVIRPNAGSLASALATNIYQGSPVALDTNGLVVLAAAGARAIGAFQGVEFTPADGRRRVSNTWPANQVATEIVAYYTQDPDIVYEIQGNASLTLAAIGQQYDWSANGTGDGNTTTGLSTVSLDVASAAANAGLQVLGIGKGVDNAAGDAFTVVEVRISEHPLRADVAGF